MVKRWMSGVCALFVVACAGESEGDGEVAGNWCGRDVPTKEECQGREVEYLELSRSGTVVTGRICEAYDKDCAPIEHGKMEGRDLSFSYSPVSVGGTVKLRLNGDQLAGTISALKCGCEMPYTFHRL